MSELRKTGEARVIVPSGRVASLIYLFLIGIFYGLTFSLTRLGTIAGIPFLAYVFWQFAGSVVLLHFICLLRREWPRFGPREVRNYAVTAFFGILVPFGVFAFVSTRLPAGIVSLAISLGPALTLIVALCLRMERFNLWRLGGILLGAAGVLLIVLPETSLPEPDMAGWVLVSLTGALGLAGGNIASLKLRPAGASSLQFATGIQTAGLVVLLPMMLGVNGWWFFDASFGTSEIALLVAMPVVAFIWWLALELVAISGPVFMSLFDNVATLAGVGWGILIFGESHSAWVWGALALLMLSVYLVNRTGPAAAR